MSDCYIEGKVDVDNNKLVDAINKHNELLEHQNKILIHQNGILSKLLDEIILIRREKL